MKKGIILASLVTMIVCLVTLIVWVTPLITGSSESPKKTADPFLTTWSLGEDGRAFSFSGNSAGHAASKPSEFQIAMDNRSGNDAWRGVYCPAN